MAPTGSPRRFANRTAREPRRNPPTPAKSSTTLLSARPGRAAHATITPLPGKTVGEGITPL